MEQQIKSEMHFVQPDRVKVTLSDKVDQKFFSIGIEKAIPQGIDLISIADDIYNSLEQLVSLKKEAIKSTMPAPRPPVQYPQQSVQQYKMPTAGNNCNKCGASMAISKQGKPYCSAKCWLGGQPQQSQGNQPYSSQPTAPSNFTSDDIPF